MITILNYFIFSLIAFIIGLIIGNYMKKVNVIKIKPSDIIKSDNDTIDNNKRDVFGNDKTVVLNIVYPSDKIDKSHIEQLGHAVWDFEKWQKGEYETIKEKTSIKENKNEQIQQEEEIVEEYFDVLK